MPELHACMSCGVSLDEPEQPATVESCAHVPVDAVKLAQQNSISLPLAVPVLQTSDEEPSCGCALPVHEKPIDEPVQPTMLESAVHPAVTDVVSMQQYSVCPPLLGVPSLQLRALSP